MLLYGTKMIRKHTAKENKTHKQTQTPSRKCIRLSTTMRSLYSCSRWWKAYPAGRGDPGTPLTALSIRPGPGSPAWAAIRFLRTALETQGPR